MLDLGDVPHRRKQATRQRALQDSDAARHPHDDRLSGIYGTIPYEDLGERHQRNVTIIADGEVDRSPWGSGTSADAHCSTPRVRGDLARRCAQVGSSAARSSLGSSVSVLTGS